MASQQVEAFSAPKQTYENAPPFPDNVPTAPLLRLSLAKLLDRDPAELNRFVRACEDLGFFYLDLYGPGDSILADADQLFQVGEKLFDLPLEEKKQYDFQQRKSYFGYKGYGANVVDKDGNLDRNEFYNVSTPKYLSRARFVTTSRCPKTTCLGSWNPYQPQKS
jgi:isopenicillin N synthase-like dioxygenase